MYRERLKTKTGCLTCRRRRKKCDEVKPLCGHCSRLGLRCSWYRKSESGNVIDIGPLPRKEVGGVRTLDHGEPTTTVVNYDEFASSFASGQAFPALTNDFAEAFDEHIIISGVYHGWEHVSKKFLLDPQWTFLITINKVLRDCGHGLVSRAALLVLFRQLMKYFAATSMVKTRIEIPAWLIPRGSQLDAQYPELLNYMFWPGVRELMIRNPRPYSSSEWWADYMMTGYRFIWPYKPEDAIQWDPERYMYRGTREFEIRARSLRSYTISEDFISRFPEFRGLAPQTEISPTRYRPSTTTSLERLYWSLLRKDHADRARRRTLSQAQPVVTVRVEDDVVGEVVEDKVEQEYNGKDKTLDLLISSPLTEQTERQEQTESEQTAEKGTGEAEEAEQVTAETKSTSAGAGTCPVIVVK